MMHDFDYDNLQKKRLARNAQYRKSGAKSRRCTLPHETLTKKELNALNGEVRTFNLTQPMTREQYLSLPDRVRAEYLTGPVRQYNISCQKLAEMFGCSNETARKELISVGVKFTKRHCMTHEQVSKWNTFLHGNLCAPDEPYEPDESVATMETEATPEKTVEDFIVPGEASPLEIAEIYHEKTPALKSAELTFHGSPEQIAGEITRFLAQFDNDTACAVVLKFDA